MLYFMTFFPRKYAFVYCGKKRFLVSELCHGLEVPFCSSYRRWVEYEFSIYIDIHKNITFCSTTSVFSRKLTRTVGYCRSNRLESIWHHAKLQFALPLLAYQDLESKNKSLGLSSSSYNQKSRRTGLRLLLPFRLISNLMPTELD